MEDSLNTRKIDEIESGVKTLSTASKNGFRAFHEAIINLDHVILSDLITPADAEAILAHARDGGGGLKVLKHFTLLMKHYWKKLSLKQF